MVNFLVTEMQSNYTREYSTVSTVIVYLIIQVNNFIGQPPGPFCAQISVPFLSDSSVHLMEIHMFTS